jgi:hypothetical protein
MFEHFDDELRQVLKLAQLDAIRFGQELEARHLLYELLGVDAAQTVAGRALAYLDVDRAAARAQLDADLARGNRQPGSSTQADLTDRDAAALRSLGIDLDEVRARIEEQFGPGALSSVGGPTEEPSGSRGGRGARGRRGWRVGRERGTGQPFGLRAGFTVEAKKLIEATLREALAVGDRHMDTGHLLLAALRTGNGWPLDDMGVAYENARTAVRAVRG